MSAEENEALVRRYFEADARGDLNALKEMLAPDFIDHSTLPGQAPDREGYIQWFEQSRAALSKVRYTIEDLLAKDDKVAVRLTGRAVHDRGKMLGLAPTGRELETSLMMFFRICGGKIVEEWSEGSGMLDLAWQQLEQDMRERERIEQELRVAQHIQQASLPKGEMFGFPRLRELVAKHADEKRPLGEFLLEELYSFVGEGWEQEDDITLLTLRRTTASR